MLVVEGLKVKSYINFICQGASGNVDVNVKDGDVITIEIQAGAKYRGYHYDQSTYTGKVTSIGENDFTIDYSQKYSSKLVTVSYTNVTKVKIE